MDCSARRRSAIANAVLAAFLAIPSCAAEGAASSGATAPAAPAGSVAPAPAASTAPLASASPPASQAPAASAAPSAPPSNAHGAELAEADEHREHHHGGFLALVAMSIKDLTLTPDQQGRVDKIRADLLAKMEPARIAARELANLLADGVAAGAIDRPKVDAAITKLVGVVQGLHEASLESLNQLHAALDAQQRASLVASLEAHWEKWKEAHGRDEQDDRQHRSGYMLALVQRLGLTKDEAAKIKKNFGERMKPGAQDHGHKEVQDHLKAFAAAFKGDKFDAKALASAKTANAHVARWGATRRARFLEAAAPVLTPDQRTKLAQMIRDDASHPEP